MSINIRRSWTRQPPPGTRPDRSIPFGRNLTFLVNGAQGFLARNLINDARGAVVNGNAGYALAPTSHGVGIDLTAVDGVLFSGQQFAGHATGDNDAYTILVVANPPSDGTVRPLYTQRYSGGGVQQCSFMGNMDVTFGASTGKLTLGIDGANGFESASAITGRMETYGIAVSGLVLPGGAAARMYRSGAPLAVTKVGTPGTTFSVLQDTYIGYHLGVGTSVAGQIVAVAVFDDIALPDALMRDYTRNIWQLFRPLAKRVWFKPSAGGGAAVFNPLSGRGGAAAQPLRHD